MIASLYQVLYASLLITTGLFLTGSFKGFPYKYALVVSLSVVLCLHFLKERVSFKVGNVLALLSLVVIILASALNGLSHGFESEFVMTELVGLLSPLVIVLMYRRDLMDGPLVRRAVLLGSCGYSLVKILSAVLVGSGAVSYVQFDALIHEYFGYSIMSLPIAGSLIRLYSANDLLLAFTPLVVWGDFATVRNTAGKWVVYLLLVASVFLSYSRYTIMIFLFVSAFSLWRSMRQRGRLVGVGSLLIVAVSISTVAIIALPAEQLRPLQDRFDPTASINQGSDALRSEQMVHISNFISERPLFGWGLGSYMKDYLRSTSSKYDYEMQLMALVFKLGIAPFITVAFILCYLLFKQLARPGAWVLLAVLFASAAFNPYIESSVFGVTTLLILSCYQRERTTPIAGRGGSRCSELS